MAKHDENKDLRLVSRVAKVDFSNKTIQTSKSTIIGIRTWGRIDYLVNYCGWFFCFNNDVNVHYIPNSDINKDNKRKREAKKAAKEQSLSNKKKKR